MDFAGLDMVEVPSDSGGLDSPALNGLHVSSLRLADFRNYESFEMPSIGALTILMGPNAIGKTSVVEAIQMITGLKSFRTNQYPQMVRWGSDSARVSANLQGDGRILSVDLAIAPGKRTYQLNGKTKRIQDLKGLLPSVCFSPDDLGLVKGPNAGRRDALDGVGSQLSKNFYAVRSDYAKLMKQKNKALRDDASDLYIDSIDEILVRVGIQLMAHRMVIIERMRPAFRDLYADISAGFENLDIAYIPSWCRKNAESAISLGESIEGYALSDSRFDRESASSLFFDYLRSIRQQERARGRSIAGPHGDEVAFLLNGRNALHFSSQGQQRSIVLAFKLAEAAVIQEIAGKKPVLLLDDVLSELDESRRKYFLSFISDDIQTFITSTNAECFDTSIMSKADIIQLPGRKN